MIFDYFDIFSALYENRIINRNQWYNDTIVLKMDGKQKGRIDQKVGCFDIQIWGTR